MANEGPIVKIYELRVTGFDSAKVEFDKLSAEIEKSKKKKQELDKLMAQASDPAKIADLTKKQQEQTSAVITLTQKLKEKGNELKVLQDLEKGESDGVGRAITAYQNLVKQYKEALINAQLMEDQFGKESQQAIEAARAAVVYESELRKIGEARKNNGLAEETKAILDNEKIKQASLKTDRETILNKQAEEKVEQQKIATQKQSLQYQIAVQKQKLAGVSTAQAEAKIAQQAANEYYQLGQALKDAELRYKNLALTQGFNNEQTKVALQEALAIRGTLDKVDQALGNYQRNVGNYSSAYNGLGVSIQQILREAPSAAVSLNTFFLAISNNLPLFFDEILKIKEEQKAANLATQEAAILAREQAVASALQAGATAEAAAAEGALAEQTVIANAAQAAAPGILQRITSSLFSLQSGLTLGVLLLTLFGSQVIAAVGQMVKGTKSTLDFTKAQNDFAEELKNTGKSYNEHIVQLEILTDRVNKTGKSFTDKQEILKDYNKEFGDSLGVAKDYNEVEKILRDKTADYIKAMYLRAEAQAALNLAIKEQEKIFEENAESQRIAVQQQQDYDNLNKFYSGETLKRMQKELQQARKITQEKTKNNSEEAENRKTYFKQQFEDYQKQADTLDSLNKIDTDPTDNVSAGNKITDPIKDRLSIIDAALKEQIAKENDRVNDIRKLHNLTYDEEITHAENLENLNVDALDKKIAYLGKQKKLDADQLAELAEFKEKRSEIELQTSKAIEDIEKKRFDEQEKIFKNELNRTIKEEQEKNNLVQDDPTASNIDKARAELAMDEASVSAHQQYYDKLLKMNSNYNQEALKNEEVTLNAMKSLRDKEAGVTNDALLKDVKATGDRLVAEFKAVMAQARLNIINSDKPQAKKDQALAEVDKQELTGILAREVASEKSQLPLYQQLLKDKQITDTQYLNFLTEMRAKQAQLADATGKELETSAIKITGLGSFIASKLRSLFSFNTINASDDKATINKKTALQDAFAQAIAQSYDLAKTAMNDYYNSEAQQIERSRANNEKKLQLELEQAKDRAQSQAEKNSLDKQFQAKKDANDRQAFEQNKKVQREQAKINLAMQLSNIAVVAYSPGPLNLLTGGISGQIMLAVQTALALASYALNIGRINSAQYEFGGTIIDKMFAFGGNLMSKVFAFGGNVAGGKFANGGNPDTTTTRGGRVKGRPHSRGGNPFIFKGRVFEDEIDELNIIRTKNAPVNKKYQLTGTHTQIASALNKIGGGVEFAPGAAVKRFATGGMLGSNLQAPIFTPSSNLNSNHVIDTGLIKESIDNQSTQLQASIKALADEQSARIDRLEVVQVTHTVTQAQRKAVAQRQIGTL